MIKQNNSNTMNLFNPYVTLSRLPIVDVCCAHNFVITMHKTKELKIRSLRFQLSVCATLRVILLLSFLLLYSSSASILTTEKEHTALAIINTFNANNATPPSNAMEGILSLKEQYSFVRAWGSYGTENGQFNGPSGIAIDPSGNVL